MKNLFLGVCMLAGTAMFATNSVETKTIATEDFACTISTSTTISDSNGDSHQVTVTNTGRTCFDAWSKNQDEIKEFKDGIEPAN